MGNQNNSAYWQGMRFWCGCINRNDGQIEETHTYEEAAACDFHHTLYFSDNAAEKIDLEEYLFFWIQNGKIIADWKNSAASWQIAEIEKQIFFESGDF